MINKSYTNTPNAQAIFRDKNIGGEALDESLDKWRGRYVHISENDIEYLEGWDQAIVDSFEAFPKLGIDPLLKKNWSEVYVRIRT